MHTSDVESTNRVHTSVCAFTLKVSHVGTSYIGSSVLVLNDPPAWWTATSTTSSTAGQGIHSFRCQLNLSSSVYRVTQLLS